MFRDSDDGFASPSNRSNARLFPFGPLSWTLFQIFICIKIWWHCPAWRTAFVSQHRVGFHTFVCPGALLGYGSLYIWNLHGNNCPVLLQMTSSTGHLPPLRRPLPRPNVPFSLCSLASSTTSSDCQALQLLNDHPPGTRPIYSYHTLIRWGPFKISFSPPDLFFFSAALLDTPNQSRTANEIYQAIEDKVKESSHALPGIQ